MTMGNKRELELDEYPEGQRFARELKTLLGKYNYDLMMIAIMRLDGEVFIIKNRDHASQVHVIDESAGKH
jgi:hypothetical protein